MIKYVIYFLSATLFLFSSEIKDYKPIYNNICYDINNTQYKALRSFSDEENKFLLVDNENLNTIIVKDVNLTQIECNSSRYSELLDFSVKEPYILENDGIICPKEGIVITTDLCPSSKKGFEERLYKTLITSFYNPVPITIFITKRWIRKHIKEFNQLKNWQEESKLNITWGNHTAYHHYHPKAKLENNYVLSPEEDLEKDILDLEIELLNRGVIPSVFFRFPGLVSDKKSIETIKSLGLITIGSNGWLANGDKIECNSIILLHGNKNEPRGINMFLKALKNGDIKELKDIKDAL